MSSDRDASHPAVLIVVSGGVADYITTPGVCGGLIDLDNIKAGDDPVGLPAGVGLEALVDEMDLDPDTYYWIREGQDE